MDSKIVTKSIKNTLVPLLKEHGFTVFTQRAAWRDCGSKIDVIKFQSLNSHDAAIFESTTFSLIVSLGIYFKCIPDRFSKLKEKSDLVLPKEYECHFRRLLHKSIAQKELPRKSIWHIDSEGDNLEIVIQDVKNQLITQGLPWFERFENMNEVMRTLLEDREDLNGTDGFGRNPSPIRSYLTGYIALSMGDYELAKKALNEAIGSGCFNHAYNLKADYESLV